MAADWKAATKFCSDKRKFICAIFETNTHLEMNARNTHTLKWMHTPWYVSSGTFPFVAALFFSTLGHKAVLSCENNSSPVATQQSRSQPKNWGSKCLISGEQQYFVWDTASRSTKWLDMLNILEGTDPWPPWLRLYNAKQIEIITPKMRQFFELSHSDITCVWNGVTHDW